MIAPRVTIGMPVFNGEEYLSAAIDSILAQTYQDFQIVISDNASTDTTGEICQAYADKDPRVRYHRNARNLGTSPNFNRVFQLSNTEYFKWAAHDDLVSPEYLSRCVKVLDQDSSVVLCHSKTARIDSSSRITGTYEVDLRLDSPKTHVRFADAIDFHNTAYNLLFGVMRSDMLRETGLMGSYVGSDRNLLAEISLKGRIQQIPEYLFFRRRHAQSYTDDANRSQSEGMRWWDTRPGKVRVLPYWTIALECLHIVGKQPFGVDQQLRCYEQMLKWLFKEGWVYLGYDVAYNMVRPVVVRRRFWPIAERLLGLGERFPETPDQSYAPIDLLKRKHITLDA